jgi:two-component system sensor histidine kinase DegS
VPVTIRTHALPHTLPPAISEAIPRVVQEAVVNAMKHAAPSRVAVDVAATPDAVRITAVDDGRGFPFKGRYDHETLTRTGSGPVSLRERVASLGGRIEIDSSDAGARVDLRLPLRPEPV